MDDQFWPALYPGLIIGALYGLTLKGVANTIAGAIGGLFGAAAAYFALLGLNLSQGIVSVIAMVVLSFIGALLTTAALRRLAAPKN